MIFYTLPRTVEPLFTDNSLNTSLSRTVFPIRAKQLSMAATAGVIWFGANALGTGREAGTCASVLKLV